MDLRQADKDEILAATGHGPAQGILYSINVSERVWVVIHDDEIEGVFGVARSESWGIPWFLATDKFNEFRLTFAKESKRFVKSLLEDYRALQNFVDSRHVASIRWLEWLGFAVHTARNSIRLHDPEVPFYLFEMRKEGTSSECAPL